MQRCFLYLVLILTAPAAASATTYIVRPDGSGDFPTIQAAIDAALDDDIIELTNGTFTGDGNRDIDYIGKALTVRSQSASAESCIIDCEASESEPHTGFHFLSGEGADAVLEGVTIINGWESPGFPSAGGILCRDASSPTITACILSTNHGSGIFCIDYSSPVITACTFSGNSANTGGGIMCLGGASPAISHCTFTGNLADWAGGGFWGSSSAATLSNCDFSGNSATHGGGIYFRSASAPTLTDCVIFNNTATHSSGGIHWEMFCTATITHCTFARNSAMRCGGMDVSKFCGVLARNCTFWGNSATYVGGVCADAESELELENTIISFSTQGEAVGCNEAIVNLVCCDIFGNAGGDWVGYIAGQLGVDGNISEDPLFCDPENWDFDLREGSPCAPFSPPNEECDLIGAWPVGCSSMTVRDQQAASPRFYLAPCAPNPLSFTTSIHYDLPGARWVTLQIFDVTGRRVCMLVDGLQPARRHAVEWSRQNKVGEQISSGTYFLQMRAANFMDGRTLIVID
ncbi:MAG: right-handed parallel beta-helix repeat-containing protein [Candidatus Eisenbacteria sp.]|nr:right-handed parallel beta-helix repeat-containing protein [Candidatus Eisenbacteria bacterium]